MRIGVIADTHIPQKADAVPQKILDDFKRVDMVIHAGDLADLSVLADLRSVCSDVRAVWGNMDPDEVRQELPYKDIITVGSFRIGVMHGFGHPDSLIERIRQEFSADRVDCIIFGHAHRPTNEKRVGVLFFNPGSATDDVFAPFKSYGILEVGSEITGKIIKV